MATLCNIEDASDSIITLLKTNKKIPSFMMETVKAMIWKQNRVASVLSKI